MISILGDRTPQLMSILHGTTGHIIDIMKYRFYMAARIDKIVISELATTDL